MGLQLTTDTSVEILMYDLDDHTIGWGEQAMEYGCAIIDVTLVQWNPTNPKMYPIEDEE